MGSDPLGKLVFQIKMEPSKEPRAIKKLAEVAITLGSKFELFEYRVGNVKLLVHAPVTGL